MLRTYILPKAQSHAKLQKGMNWSLLHEGQIRKMKIVTKKSKGQQCARTSSHAAKIRSPVKFRNSCEISRVLYFQSTADLFSVSDLQL